MRLDQVTLRVVRLPLVRTFRTSSSTKSHIDHILIHVRTSDGGEGWGESASPSDPYYCPETTETCWHILKDFLVPSVLGKDWNVPRNMPLLFGPIKGNGFARAGLEMAAWDAWTRSEGVALAGALGGTRTVIESGVSLGIEREIPALLDQVEQYVAEGYRRIKLKIAPGWDVEPVRAVRERFPGVPLQVDANSAYKPSAEHVEILRALDEFDLLLIEQPLAHDDIIDHADLQKRIKTPICLDESIHSAEDALKAINLGACRVINIKVSRVGGLAEAQRIAWVCQGLGIPVWCGGMHEFGIGRAANIAIASTAAFTLAGDVSGSDKYYHEDLVEPPIVADRGLVAVPTGPGLGHEPILERIERHTLRTLILR